MNQQSAPIFASTLDEMPTEVKAWPLLPEGTYLARVGQWEDHTAEESPYVEIPFSIISPMEDIDLSEIEAVGGLEDMVVNRRYFTSPKAVRFLDQLHQDCGVDLSQPNTRRARNDMIINAEVLVVITHGQNKAGTRTYANVDRTLPV
jgi:hypothetical protein